MPNLVNELTYISVIKKHTMILTIRLPWLDNTDVSILSETVDVFLENHPERIIGLCKIIRDEKGNFIGELDLDEDVDHNLYIYYNKKEVNGSFIFTGISLYKEHYNGEATSQLKDNIIH